LEYWVLNPSLHYSNADEAIDRNLAYEF